MDGRTAGWMHGLAGTEEYLADEHANQCKSGGKGRLAAGWAEFPLSG